MIEMQRWFIHKNADKIMPVERTEMKPAITDALTQDQDLLSAVQVHPALARERYVRGQGLSPYRKLRKHLNPSRREVPRVFPQISSNTFRLTHRTFIDGGASRPSLSTFARLLGRQRS